MIKPPLRDVHGVFLLNKPVGISSNTALQRVKRLFQARKAGHTGSLDNLASGLLPICLGEATKLAGFLLETDKTYQVDCILGITTTTGDAEGDIIQTCTVENVDIQRVESVLGKFKGEIQQIPPMYSALKHQGKPLYALARQGKTVERAPRTITIYALELQDFANNRLSLQVHCSKGTYIRTLVEDIGKALGCGAYVTVLHRTKVNQYQEMVDFATLEQSAQQGLEALDRLLIPPQAAVSHLPTLTLSLQNAIYLRQGQMIRLFQPVSSPGLVTLLTDKAHFLGIGQISQDGSVIPKRLLNLNDEQ